MGKLTILGLDHGNEHTGFGVVEYDDETKGFKYIDCGIWHCTEGRPYSYRTQSRNVQRAVDKYNPDCIGLESAKSNRGFVATAALQELVGVFKVTLLKYKLPYISIPPTSLKKIVTGRGNATKMEVAESVARKFGLRVEDIITCTYYKRGIKKGTINEYLLDSSDALAICLALPIYYDRVGKFDYLEVSRNE